MTKDRKSVVFFKPVWMAYNADAQAWVAETLAAIGITKPKEKQTTVVASFLHNARWAMLSNKSLACPRNNNFWSKYPLAGREVIGQMADLLMQHGFLHKIPGSGRWYWHEDDQGQFVHEKVTTLYRVDEKLVSSPYYTSGQFIEVGRPLVQISKAETQGERVARKARREASPKIGIREAEKHFGKPYHLLKDEVNELNSFYQKHPLQLPDQGSVQTFCGSVGRVFHGSRLDAGGRFYGAYTGLDGDYRLQCKIDGEPIVQIDLNAAQAVLFSSLMGYKIKDTGREGGGWDDLYGEISAEIYGVGSDQAEQERSRIKAVGVELIGCGNPHKAGPSQELQSKHGVGEWDFQIYRDKILEWVPGLKHLDRKHYNGAGFITYHESQIILKTIQSLHESGVPAYPMHDCLIVKAKDRDLGVKTLRDIANRYILDHCRTHGRPEEINIMVAYSVEELGKRKKREKGFYK